jgi:hypothetical protein
MALLSILAKFAFAEPQPPLIDVPIKYFVQKGAQWNTDLAREVIRISDSYFRQRCGISLTIKSEQTGDEPGLLEMKTYKEDEKFAKLNPDKEGVFIIFTGRELEIDGTGYAHRKSHPDKNEDIVNTIFIFNQALDWYREGNYDILSHELTHILLDVGHNKTEGNILSENYDGLDITEEQCEKIRNNIQTKALY